MAEAAATWGVTAAHASSSAVQGLARPGPQESVPWAGVVLLVALVIVALLARRWSGRAGGGGSGMLARLSGPVAAARQGAASVRTVGALDVRTRLVVVEWQGQRLLLACGGGAPPVVLAREPMPGDAAPTGEAQA
jgi:hypothetical protein